MPFGIRTYPEPIDANEPFYACPLCTTVEKNEQHMINHLVADHGLAKKDAKALVKQTAEDTSG